MPPGNEYWRIPCDKIISRHRRRTKNIHMKYIILIAVVYLFGSCSRDFDFQEQDPTLEIAVESYTFSVGEEIAFKLVGKAGLISVFTGESGHDYSLKDADSPDRPISIKGNSDIMPEYFTYTYSVPGVYDLYFIAKNANRFDSKENVKKIQISVE